MSCPHVEQVNEPGKDGVPEGDDDLDGRESIKPAKTRTEPEKMEAEPDNYFKAQL